jgi:N utilization substance protein B
MGRRGSRIQAFELLFSGFFIKSGVDEILRCAGVSDNSFEVDKFALKILRGVSKNIDKIDEIIKKNIKNWDFERLSYVVKTTLRIAVYEMIFVKNVPAAVSTSEAVNIVKKYGGEDEPAFVNAVLTSVEKSDERKQNEKK